MSQSSYFTGNVVQNLEGFRVRNYEQFSRATGKETEYRRTAVACYKCGDQYFLGHCYLNKIVIPMEEIVIKEILEEKISTFQP